MNLNCSKTTAFDFVNSSKHNVDSIANIQETICPKNYIFANGVLKSNSCPERSSPPDSYLDSSLHNITTPHHRSPSAHERDIANIPPLISMTQCPTSMSSFPQFPNPMTLHEDGYGMGLQPSLARSSPGSRRTRHFVPNDCKDEYYWQKRRKNNEAARKSREKRRTIDSVLEKKVLLLTHENKLLRDELHALKLKYGEVPSETQQDDWAAYKMKLAKKDQVDPKHVDESSVSAMDLSNNSLQTSLADSVLPQTTISLPRLNVILEGEKASSDPTSSAKLVLSNLASGTLILSPVVHTGGSKLTSNPISPDRKMASCRTFQELVATIQNTKAVEAAHALATLFRGSENSEGNGEQDIRSDSRSSSIDKTSDSSGSEARKPHNLPHKLRFKHAHRDVAVD